MAAKKKTSKPAQVEQPVKPSLTGRLLTTVFQPDVLLMASIIVTGGVLAPAAARWVPDLNQRTEYRLNSTAITIPETPGWIPEDFVSEALRKAEFPADVSVLEPDLAARLARAFENNPWVKGRVEVTVQVPARAAVRFEYRRPVAMVRLSDGFYPVDLEAAVLPTRGFPREQLGQYPLITGITTPSSNGLGVPWDDIRVLAGARLASLLSPFWDEWKLQAIEAPKRDRLEQKYEDLEFTIRTQGGSCIRWGRPPGNKHPLEVTDAQKIGRLKEFVARVGSFDQGPWEININNLKDVVYQPLPSEQTGSVKPATGRAARSSRQTAR